MQLFSYAYHIQRAHFGYDRHTSLPKRGKVIHLVCMPSFLLFSLLLLEDMCDLEGGTKCVFTFPIKTLFSLHVKPFSHLPPTSPALPPTRDGFYPPTPPPHFSADSWLHFRMS